MTPARVYLRGYFSKLIGRINAETEKIESVEEFKAELKRLSTPCAFGTHLEEAQRDRFVCGLQSTVAQKRLLTEKTLFFFCIRS